MINSFCGNKPLFLLHFCIFNEIRPVLDAMAIGTSIFSNKPFVRGVLQMFFKCEYTFFFLFSFFSALGYNSMLFLVIVLQVFLTTLRSSLFLFLGHSGD